MTPESQAKIRALSEYLLMCEDAFVEVCDGLYRIAEATWMVVGPGVDSLYNQMLPEDRGCFVRTVWIAPGYLASVVPVGVYRG